METVSHHILCLLSAATGKLLTAAFYVNNRSAFLESTLEQFGSPMKA